MASLGLMLAASLACAASPAAPEFAGARGWLNASAPVTLAGLRGKVVLLYFADDWSAAGRRTILAAKRLEAAFPEAVAVVGVRSPAAGRPAQSPQSLRLALLRREVSHAVADDGHGAIARAYGIVDPPQLRLIGADGALAAAFGNSSKYADILKAAGELVSAARARGELKESLLEPALERDKERDGPLAFPTHLAYDGRRFAVCDSGHNRTVVLDRSGRLRAVVGNGAIDYRDGQAASAGFDHPEGAASDGTRLFLSDTANDAVRRVDENGLVVTLVDLLELRWPRGLAWAPGWLYVAAGETHDVWAVDLKRSQPFRFAGSGQPGRADGPPMAARFEEPAALAILGNTLWVADSQAATLRAIPLDAPEVRTPPLRGPGSPLSRPEALAAFGARLLVADAGDGRVKSLDPATGELSVFADGLLQPSGLAVAGSEVVVADTGRGKLVRFSREGRRLGELVARGLEAPPAGPPMAFLPPREDVELPAAPAAAGAGGRIELSLELPAGFKLNPRAPFSHRVSETRGQLRFSAGTRKGFTLSPRFPIALEFEAAPGRSEALLDVDFYYCRQDGKGLCRSASKRYRVVVDAAQGAPATAVKVTARP